MLCYAANSRTGSWISRLWSVRTWTWWVTRTQPECLEPLLLPTQGTVCNYDVV